MARVNLTFCLNLDRRPDRWERFVAEIRSMGSAWPLPPVVRFAAVDGVLLERPDWWTSSAGAWGCLHSHLATIAAADRAVLESVAIFEDDAFFCPSFPDRYRRFAAEVPDDWDMIYLGGQHLDPKLRPPVPLAGSTEVLVPWAVQRTHAYMVRHTAYRLLLDLLTDLDWVRNVGWFHVDRLLAWIMASGRLKVYCPRQWLVGQEGGSSDIFQQERGPSYFRQPLDLGAIGHG